MDMKDKIKAYMDAAKKAGDEVRLRETVTKAYLHGVAGKPIEFVEPEVWVEFCRMRCTLTYQELNELVPDGMVIRCFFDEKTGWQVWEYLM